MAKTATTSMAAAATARTAAAARPNATTIAATSRVTPPAVDGEVDRACVGHNRGRCPTSSARPASCWTEHELSVLLDHDRPDGERITVFAREVADPDGRDRPFLVFLEGGPGFEAPRPARHPTAPSWLDRALSEFRVLMLDQRGTGRSTPAGALPGRTPEEQAEYLKHFRADSIVRDAEWVRRELSVDRWSVLGQSFGGFCVLTYLSLAPEGLREAFFTGGLPPIGRPVDDVYRGTYERVLDRNQRYDDR